MMATSRTPTGLPSSAWLAAASSSARASSTRSAGGSVRWAFGDPSSAPASVSARPVRCVQAVNTRTAVARRDIVVRARPSVCCRASQLRSVRMSSVPTSWWPRREACWSIPAMSPT
jgi:hypothetical protein